MAAKIVGSMSLLISDKQVIIPYVTKLMPMLLSNLSDPNNDVRSASSKAIGTLGNSVDKKNEDNLLSWLLSSVRKDSNIAERSGAAQGNKNYL
jgi:hypothetical protein